MPAARLNELGYAARACRKYAVTFLHHKNIIEARPALFAPTYIFKIAQRLALAVHIIRRIACRIKRLGSAAEHIGGYVFIKLTAAALRNKR